MALATRCPNCQATFRVVSDQLKLRGGLVRCGSCRHVFDAIGSLSYIDDAVLTAPAAPVTIATPAPPAAAPPVADAPAMPSAPTTASEAPPSGDHHAASSTEVAGERAEEAPRSLPEAIAARVRSATAESTAAVDPLAVPTLLAPSAIEPDSSTDPATSSESRGTRRKRAARPDTGSENAEHADVASAAPEAESPAETQAAAEAAFLRASGRPRGFSIFFGGGSAVLALVLLLQSAVLFRTELITRWPQLRPTLVQVCDLYGCSVGWPTRAELLAVVGTELQAIPGTDILELTAVVRNRASFRVALPAVEITLTDTNNRTLARKVFAPVDYLASSGEPSSRINEGLGAGGDYIVRITFEARGLNAAGFVVYPFYL